MIDEKTFELVISKINESETLSNELYSLGIDILNMEQPLLDAVWILLKVFFTDTGIELIEWWLYEGVDKVVTEMDKRLFNDNDYDLTKIKDLYSYLIKDYKRL